MVIAGNGVAVGLLALLDDLGLSLGDLFDLDGIGSSASGSSIAIAATDDGPYEEEEFDLADYEVDLENYDDTLDLLNGLELGDVVLPWSEFATPTGAIAGADDGIDFQGEVTDGSFVWVGFNFRIEGGQLGVIPDTTDDGPDTSLIAAPSVDVEFPEFDGQHGIVFNGISDGEFATSSVDFFTTPDDGVNLELPEELQELAARVEEVVADELSDPASGTWVRISRNFRVAGVDDGIHFGGSILENSLEGQFGIYDAATVQVDRNGFATIADVDGEDGSLIRSSAVRSAATSTRSCMPI